MDIADYIRWIDIEGDRFAAAAEAGSLDVDIAPCEGWDMRALVRHLGLIHLWAAGTIAFPGDDWFDSDDIPDMGRYWPELGSAWPTDDNLVSWYRDTKKNLVRVLENAPADHQCFSFLPAPTPVTMWSRRQASEIAIHRFDAESARGVTSHFEAAFAADMLDELLMGFGPRSSSDDEDQPATDQVLHVHATDVDEHWSLTFRGDGIEATRTAAQADLTIAATAAELYLIMWNRADASRATLVGDPSVLSRWTGTGGVRWSGGE